MEQRTVCLFGHKGAEKRVFIEITGLCNMKCKHCMNSSSESGMQGLDKENLFRLLEEVAKQGFKRVYISGGEPLLYKSIDEVLEVANKLGLSITLATNGWYILEHIEIIEKYVDIVSISLDGIGAVHDMFRGTIGSYDKVIEALRALKAKGVTTKISSVIWKKNIGQLEDIVLIAKSVGVMKVNFSILVPTGRAENNEEIEIEKTDLAMIYQKISVLSRKYKEHIDVEIKRPYGGIQTDISCPGGSSLLHVDVKGTVSPCSWIAKTDCGRYSVKWKEGMFSEKIRELEEFENLLLKRKEMYNYTGCPAMSYIYSGDYQDEDPINMNANYVEA